MDINVYIGNKKMSTSKLTKTSGTCAFYKRVAVRLEGHAKQMQMRGDLGNLADVNLRMAMAYRDLEPTVQSSTAKIDLAPEK